MPVSGLFQGTLAPKEYDTIKLSPPNQPTTIKWEQSGKVLREVKLTYESGTENVEKVEVTV